MATFAFNVWLGNKRIDTIFYDAPGKSISEKIDYIKTSLIKHDCYDPVIKVTWTKGQRITETVYELHGDYGQGFELLCAALTRREIIADRKAYRENSPCPLKIIKRLKIKM